MLEKTEGPRLEGNAALSPPPRRGDMAWVRPHGVPRESDLGSKASASPQAPSLCSAAEPVGAHPWVGQWAQPSSSLQIFTEHLLWAGAVLGARGIHMLVGAMKK